MIHFVPRATVFALAFVATVCPAAAGFPCDKFEKGQDGSWVAKEPVEILGPSGRLDFTPGEIYREGQPRQGLDLAKLLAANCGSK